MTIHGDIVLSIIGMGTLGVVLYSITRYCRKKYLSAEIAPIYKFDEIKDNH